MATPRRSANGRFVKGGGKATATRKRRSSRRTTTTRAAAPRRRTYRRNPPRSGLVKNITEGIGDAFAIIGGEAAVGAIPGMFNLPTTGNTGLITQGLTAVGVGLVADMALPRKWSKPVLGGALAVPIRAALVSAGIPFVSDALTPTPALGRYVSPVAYAPALTSGGGSRALRGNRGARGGLGRYVPADRRLYS